uniref:Uncharacterized protein n=1 Tax=Fagus sylvatica TaxID=28930 RepID=A0A2N9HKM6_FAGSY
MERQPSMKLDLHLTPSEAEPKTMTRDQYELARAAAVIAYMQKNKLPRMETVEDKPEKSTKSEPAAEDAEQKPMPQA